MGIEVEPFARLPFFNAPPSRSPSLSTCRVLLPAHFVFRSEPEIIIATWRYPPHRAQLQQEALDEDISEIQRARQSVEP